MRSRFSVLTATAASLALCSAVASLTFADLIEPVAQDRSIVGTAYASDDIDFFDDDDGDAATDFGAWNVGVGASAETDGSIGSGGGSQNSEILADRLVAAGSMFATGEVWEFGFTAGGAATNRFDVIFDLTAEATYLLTGSMGRFDGGNTTLLFEGPGGSIETIVLQPNSFDPTISLSGTVDAGQYRLTIESVGSADGFDFDSGYASGEFDINLQFDSPASVPSVGSMASRLVASPNPFVSSTRLSFAEPGQWEPAGPVRILDANGRVLRVLRRSRDAGASPFVTWDGQDSNGRQVADGVYFARVGNGNSALQAKVLRLRR